MSLRDLGVTEAADVFSEQTQSHSCSGGWTCVHLNLLIYQDLILDLLTTSSAMFVVLLLNFVFSPDSQLLKVELPVYSTRSKAAIDLPVKRKALELLSDQPTHSPPLRSLSLSLSFCYPRWQGASLHASELLKLGQTTPLGISWSRPRRRSSPRGQVSMISRSSNVSWLCFGFESHFC